jgi:hypothetical protein
VFEEGDAEEKDGLSFSEEEEEKRGEVIGQAVKTSRRKNSRRMRKEYRTGNTSTSSIDLDEVVQEGYSDDDDYDDDEDMFDDGSKSKKRIQRHPSHTLDLDDLEEEDEYNDNLKHSEDDSAEFDLDSVEIKKKREEKNVDDEKKSDTNEEEFGLDDIDAIEEDDNDSRESDTNEEEFGLDDIETKDDDVIDRSDLSEIDGDSFALDGSDVESVFTEQNASDTNSDDGEFDLDGGDDDDDDERNAAHEEYDDDFDLDDVPPPPPTSQPPQEPKRRRNRPSPIKIPKRMSKSRQESVANLESFQSVLTEDTDDEDDGKESSDHSELDL